MPFFLVYNAQFIYTRNNLPVVIPLRLVRIRNIFARQTKFSVSQMIIDNLQKIRVC